MVTNTFMKANSIAGEVVPFSFYFFFSILFLLFDTPFFCLSLFFLLLFDTLFTFDSLIFFFLFDSTIFLILFCAFVHHQQVSVPSLFFFFNPHQPLKYKVSHDNERLSPVVGSLAAKLL